MLEKMWLSERVSKNASIAVDHVVQIPSGDSGLQNSIVRIHNMHIDSKKRNKSRFYRRDAVVIENNVTGEKILRYVMGNPGGISISKTAVALDYDAVDTLGIRFREPVTLVVRRANAIEVYQWFWSHPDLNVQLSMRLGLVGTVLGIIGFFTGLIPLFA